MNPEEVAEQTFRNTVEINKDELLKLINGERAIDVFKESPHKRLKKYGIIYCAPGTRRTRPTPRAMEILRELGAIPAKK